MSDTFLRIIPTDPAYIPDENSQSKAQNLLRDFFKPLKVEMETTSEIEFIDQGSNFEGVFCNLCGQEIETKDWQDAMDKGYETRFKDLNFQTPCCSSETSLNELKYDWPAGFSRFCISIQNPQTDLDQAILEELQHILASSLRLIWAHY